MQNPEESAEVTAIFNQCDTDGDGLVALEEFQLFVQKATTKLLSFRRQEEMRIARSFKLDAELVQEFRSDLPMFWQLYTRFCRQDALGEHQRGVHRDSLLALLVEAGVTPSTGFDAANGKQAIRPLDSTSRQIETTESVIYFLSEYLNSFPMFLNIVHESRRRNLETMQEELRTMFNSYDRSRKGCLSKQDVFSILEEFGMLPRTKEEQEEVGRVIDWLDKDGSGGFDFEEFQEFFLRMTEQVRLAERQKEYQQGLDMGLTSEQFSILRRQFLQIGPNADGTVSQLSVLHMMAKLKSALDIVNIDEEPLRIWTRQAQQSPETELEFIRFLAIIKAVLVDAALEGDASVGDRESNATQQGIGQRAATEPATPARVPKRQDGRTEKKRVAVTVTEDVQVIDD